ncbi:MAG: GTP-binding protein, partial [Pseudolabrys sp.]
MQPRRTPVHVLTGFLGSGKTTLLRHLLGDPSLRDTVVVINEFGEVGLDHLLVREVNEDVVLLPSGCLCCVLRDDLISTLSDLHRAQAVGEIPPFSRIVVETTGLADPMPILQAILSDKQLARLARLGEVVTTVDAVSGHATIDRYQEAVRQIAAANCLVLTKTDAVDDAQADAAAAQLQAMNPTARLLRSRQGAFPAAADLFRDDGDERVLPAAAAFVAQGVDPHGSHDAISTFAVTLERPVALDAVIDWLELLLASRGDNVLRVKGYVAATGHDRPLVIQSVQRVLYRPEPLVVPVDDPHVSRLVF